MSKSSAYRPCAWKLEECDANNARLDNSKSLFAVYRHENFRLDWRKCAIPVCLPINYLVPFPEPRFTLGTACLL